ncbi:hypothetical protein EI94DRAFT_1706000 [Lactarius quietus]|nr:hypothetical protein EI94DRAFT_1706000 [Lactarius quietus]
MPPSSTSSLGPVTGELSTQLNHTGIIVGSVLKSVPGSTIHLLFICFHKRWRNRCTDPATCQVLWIWDNVNTIDYDLDAGLDNTIHLVKFLCGQRQRAQCIPASEWRCAPQLTKWGAYCMSRRWTSQDSSGRPICNALTSGISVASTSPPAPPLPPGTTSTDRSEPTRAPDDGERLLAYRSPASGSSKRDELVDYLDILVPHPTLPFASISSVKAISPHLASSYQSTHVA